MISGLSGYLKGVKKAIGNIGHGQQQFTPTLGRIRVGSREIEEIKLISQGGYAYVFKVRDIHTGEIFALKKMICQSPERLNTAKNEIKILKSLPSHPNLLAVYDTSVENKDGCYYVYVLLEFCADGSIFDLMEKYESTRLTEKQIIFIMREVCEGVKVLHSMKPPIAHRDLKIENVLLSNKKFKLCDFGSCSSSYVDFAKIPQSQYNDYEEEYEKNTTLMYRPPEMCDPYLKQVVCEKVDVWMLGCILFTMCFYKHPFQEMTKLSIVNAAFAFPEDHKYPEKMVDLIRLMLTPNPKTRPNIYEVCDLFENYFNLNNIKLNNDALRVREDQKKKASEMRKFEGTSSRKFQGDIPVDELYRLQQKLAKGDQGYNNEDGVDYDDDDDYGGGFGDNSKQAKKGNKHSSPGILQAQNQSSKFQDFGGVKNTSTQKQEQHFKSSPGINANDWDPFGTSTTTTSSQNQNQSKPQLQIKTDPKVNEQWDNFNFGGAPQTQKFNSVSGGASSGNNFGFPTQAQTTMNRNVQQTNFFGGNNNQNSNQGQFNRGFQQNNNGSQQNSNGGFQQNNNGFGFQQQNNNNFGFQQQQQNNLQNNNQAQFKGFQQQNNNGFQQQNNFGFQQQNNQGQFYGNNNRGFQQNQGGFQQQQQNNFGGNQNFNQGNNTWGNFGGGGAQQFNSVGGQQNVNRTTTVSNNLLDLADSQPVQQDTASMLKALYAANKK